MNKASVATAVMELTFFLGKETWNKDKCYKEDAIRTIGVNKRDTLLSLGGEQKTCLQRRYLN